jgi:hypothetical protein
LRTTRRTIVTTHRVTKAQQSSIDAFFNYARMRHQCYVMKHADPLWLTRDPILAEYSFCNVFRELDKTTKWFRENVRDPMSKKRDPRLLLAAVVFRMFNRIQTGEAIFCDDNLLGDHSAFDDFTAHGNTTHLKKAILRRLGKKGPFVTGAYIIAGPGGMSKLDGMCEVIKRFYLQKRPWKDGIDRDWREVAEIMRRGRVTLQEAHSWLRQFDYLGVFHSYEIVTDLRHTFMLGKAVDVYTWANPGPGCKRGMNRVMGRDKKARDWGSTEELLNEMDILLDESRQRKQWVDFAHGMRDKYPRIATPLEWEMRDVEHTLCEFDKYERTRAGEGRPRGKYRGHDGNRS